jgi:hypothetical protein
VTVSATRPSSGFAGDEQVVRRDQQLERVNPPSSGYEKKRGREVSPGDHQVTGACRAICESQEMIENKQPAADTPREHPNRTGRNLTP